MDTRASSARKSFIVGFKDKDGKPAIIKFAKRNHIREVKQLLASGAKIDDVDEKGMTALHHSAGENCKAMVKLLLKHGADVDARDATKKTPLFNAVSAGNLATAKILLQHGANVNIADEDGYTVLHVAAEECIATSVVKLLLEFGAHDAGSGWRALYFAIDVDNVAVARLLLGCGAKLNDIHGCLMDAICNESVEMVKLILEHGGVHSGNYDKVVNPMPLIHAVIREDMDVAVGMTKWMLAYGANVSGTNPCRRTPLHFAAEKGHYGVVKLLLDSGANINAVDENKSTALHDVASTEVSLEMKDYLEDNYVQTINLLLEYGADINCVDDDGRTPLQCAIQYQHASVVSALKKHIIKAKALNIQINEKNLQYLEMNIKELDEEIAKMKGKKIGISNTSFYDFLRKNGKELALCVRNKNILQDLETGTYKNEFPKFFEVIEDNFKMAKYRMNLLNSSICAFKFLSGKELPEFITMEVLNDLTNSDLENLIKAGPDVLV